MKMTRIPSREELETRSKKFMGNKVRDTKGREGIVKRAHPYVWGIIALWVHNEDTDIWFITDNEHATMVRDVDEQ